MGFKRQLLLAAAAIFLDLCLLAGLLCILWGAKFKSARQKADWEEASVREVPEGLKAVALTFDDGPSAKYTGILLDGLKERGVKASFFLIGECIEGNEDLVRRMEEEGHLVGVHCLRHVDLAREKTETAVRQLETAKEMITAATGKEPEYVRPPFGSWNDALSERVSMEPVFWSVDSLDWKLKDTNQIVTRVLKDTENGDIILMHDEYAASVEAAFQIIDILTANGYTFVTVDELSID